MEAKLEAKMDGLKEEIMEVLKNFVTKKTPESENASHEIHDEDTRKVNQEWRNSKFGLKTNHVPKIASLISSMVFYCRLLAFSFVQDKPSSSIIIFDITLGPKPPSMRQKWVILSIIFT
jgi:hypothetical protein